MQISFFLCFLLKVFGPTFVAEHSDQKCVCLKTVVFLFYSPGAFEKSALAESVVTAFPCLKDPQGITGYVSIFSALGKNLPM